MTHDSMLFDERPTPRLPANYLDQSCTRWESRPFQLRNVSFVACQPRAARHTLRGDATVAYGDSKDVLRILDAPL